MPADKLSIEQPADIAAQPLENQRHERFAALVAQGANNTVAYGQAYPDSTPDASRSSGADLLAKPSVSQRVAWLKAQNAGKAILSKAESQEFLAQVVRAQLAQLPENSPLVQSLKRKDGETTEITVPNKLKAIELNAKLAGWLDNGSAVTVTLQLAFFGSKPS